MKIGLYGGTYDPIHLGHIKIAQKAVEQFDLDELWFIPAKIPPHKINSNVTDTIHRLNMLTLAVSELDKRFKISTFELDRENVSFSYLTLTQLTDLYSDVEFYFIIGEDSLRDFPKWKHPEIISSLVKIIVAPRFLEHKENIERYISQYKLDYNANIYILDFPLVPISSTDIRTTLFTDSDIKKMIPDSVFRYILDNNLYK